LRSNGVKGYGLACPYGVRVDRYHRKGAESALRKPPQTERFVAEGSEHRLRDEVREKIGEHRCALKDFAASTVGTNTVCYGASGYDR
jgi:hypothetical protein